MGARTNGKLHLERVDGTILQHGLGLAGRVQHLDLPTDILLDVALGNVQHSVQQHRQLKRSVDDSEIQHRAIRGRHLARARDQAEFHARVLFLCEWHLLGVRCLEIICE